MPDDAELAAIVARSYQQQTWRAGALTALYTVSGADRVIAIPGTRAEISDWLRDLDIAPRWSSHLGVCHRGFLDGAEELRRRAPLADQDFAGAVLVGHSMGGAIALLLAAILITENVFPRAVVTFGAPRCGSWKLRRLLRRVPLRLYRNGDDPVPEIPWMPGLYVQPRALIPVGDAALDPLADHPIAAYRRALAAIEEMC